MKMTWKRQVEEQVGLKKMQSTKDVSSAVHELSRKHEVNPPIIVNGNKAGF